MMHLHSRVELAEFEPAVQDLLAACEKADGSVALSFEKSLNFDKSMPSWFLAVDEAGTAREAPRLLGLASIFCPSREEAEISAYVQPEARRRGVFTALLGELEARLQEEGFKDELLVVDRRSPAGALAAARLGAELDFTEYGLSHPGAAALPEAARKAAGRITLRRAVLEDLPLLVDLYLEAFGGDRAEEEGIVRTSITAERREQYVALAEGRPVGAAALGLEEDCISINGIAVFAALRGKGYGKALVARCLELAWERGQRAVIDVDSTNETAYQTYLGVGFSVDRAMDYWRRPFPRKA